MCRVLVAEHVAGSFSCRPSLPVQWRPHSQGPPPVSCPGSTSRAAPPAGWRSGPRVRGASPTRWAAPGTCTTPEQRPATGSRSAWWQGGGWRSGLGQPHRLPPAGYRAGWARLGRLSPAGQRSAPRRTWQLRSAARRPVAPMVPAPVRPSYVRPWCLHMCACSAGAPALKSGMRAAVGTCRGAVPRAAPLGGHVRIQQTKQSTYLSLHSKAPVGACHATKKSRRV